MISGFEDGDIVTSTIERWSPPTKFGKRYRQDLNAAAETRVFVRAIVFDIETEQDGARARRLKVGTFRGNRFTVGARAIVLAGGGLEVARLLLAAGRERDEAFGNQSGWLGRGYMCHVHGSIARVKIDQARRVVFGYERDRNGVYCRRRFVISEEAQRRFGLLNMYALLDRPLIGSHDHDDALISLAFLAKRMTQRQSRDTIGKGKYAVFWWHMRNILMGAPEVVTFLPGIFRDRFLQERRIPSLLSRPRSNRFHVYFHCEQLPTRENRVLLGAERDAFDMPKLHIRYGVNDAEVDSIYRAHVLLDQELRRQGCGEMTFLTEDPIADARKTGSVLGHHIGTTRMAGDSSQGVVDESCRVFGMANLFVAGSSVFPTSSQAHPTLTIVAMAIRLGAHLRKHLASL
jgi:choline dehydrogenase-like flavoprotein